MGKEGSLSIHKAKKLLEANKMLTRSLRLEEILKNLIHVASELIDVLGVIIIYLYDHKTNTLRFAEGNGINKKYLKKISFVPGESITGKIFNEKESKLFISEDEIDEYMSNMSEENFKYYFKGVYKQKIKSAFVVPIMKNNHCYGVVIVDNFDYDGIFTKEDMQVIEIVADQSAIAIENAFIYKDLREKNVLLKRSISIHNQFYQIMLKGYGIERIIALLQRLIESKVKLKTEHICKYQTENCFPIVRDDETLGVLLLEKPFEKFSEMDQIVIEQASLSITLELMKRNALFEKEIHFREEVFKQLIEGVSSRELYRILNYLNWHQDSHIQCIIIEGNNKALWSLEKLIEKERMINNIEQLFQSFGLKAFIFSRAFQIIIIVSDLSNQIKKQLIEQVNLQIPNKDIVIGIGRKSSINQLSVTYEEALKSIEYAKYYQKDLVEYEKLGVERLLYEIDDEILDKFIHDKLSTLMTLDKTFIHTLQTFITLNKNHKQVSKHLHIHPNTLYYRLRKIEAVLNINLDDEKDWIDLVIAFNLYVMRHKN